MDSDELRQRPEQTPRWKECPGSNTSESQAPPSCEKWFLGCCLSVGVWRGWQKPDGLPLRHARGLAAINNVTFSTCSWSPPRFSPDSSSAAAAVAAAAAAQLISFIYAPSSSWSAPTDWRNISRLLQHTGCPHPLCLSPLTPVPHWSGNRLPLVFTLTAECRSTRRRALTELAEPSSTSESSSIAAKQCRETSLLQTRALILQRDT